MMELNILVVLSAILGLTLGVLLLNFIFLRLDTNMMRKIILGMLASFITLFLIIVMPFVILTILSRIV